MCGMCDVHVLHVVCDVHVLICALCDGICGVCMRYVWYVCGILCWGVYVGVHFM